MESFNGKCSDCGCDMNCDHYGFWRCSNCDNEYDGRGEKPDLTPQTNIGRIMEYCMTVTDPTEAKSFWEEMMQWSLANWNVKGVDPTRENAERTMLNNLGYWAGYYNPEVGRRIRNLFGAVHPIFG